MEILDIIFGIFIFVFVLVCLVAIRASYAQVRPTERCIVERFGKFNRFKEAGLTIGIPLIERLRLINVTERMVTCNKQEVITGDNLNAQVSAQVYYKIKGDETSVKNSQYNVDNVHVQIVSLAQTTLRNVMGGLTLREANSQRAKLNLDLQAIISKETEDWGIEIVRCEIADINAPDDVQKAMNKVVMAESEKRAALDFATAVETKADGDKRAKIKNAEAAAKEVTLAAEANAESITVNATAKAEAIRTVNKAAEETFVGNAVTLKKLEVAEKVLENNAKFFIPEGTDLNMIVSEVSGISSHIVPINKKT